ncbi:MAG: peptidoglycan DD-metalloendopeptidase family protein [Ignavibacteriaceae bacterium]
MTSNQNLIETLNAHQFVSVVPFDLHGPDVYVFDFSDSNEELKEQDFSDLQKFIDFSFEKLKENNAEVGVGGYAESRSIYKRSEVFKSGEEYRSVHLGIDITAEAGTEIFAPLNGKVHSFQNNSSFGDYGPTIILEHNLNGEVFYTLYGHLSLNSLNGLFEGKEIKKGQKIAEFGDPAVNVGWPPHLHFQLITDMLGKKGDFPGVCTPSEKEYYLNICPDPNLILKIEKLK